MDWKMTTARRDGKHLSFGIYCCLYERFDGNIYFETSRTTPLPGPLGIIISTHQWDLITANQNTTVKTYVFCIKIICDTNILYLYIILHIKLTFHQATHLCGSQCFWFRFHWFLFSVRCWYFKDGEAVVGVVGYKSRGHDIPEPTQRASALCCNIGR